MVKMNDSKQTYYLTSEAILKYFMSNSEHIETLILCKGTEINIATTDFNLYEALGSIENRDNFSLSKLIKFLEVVKIEPAPKKILTHERVEELRKLSKI
ncbi:MAG: hypothetical protein KatS3mg002_0712 [Candidatus Woesearchaeota archaeon]|nr:MAG: hypothetical protein KatS3mg002_0712 [Candidatus Woesearchaeota archaeon]